MQDIESDTGYDTRRRVLEGVFARVSQTAVYDTCGWMTFAPHRDRRWPRVIGGRRAAVCAAAAYHGAVVVRR